VTGALASDMAPCAGVFNGSSGARPMICGLALRTFRGMYLSQVLALDGLTNDVAGTMKRTQSTVANAMLVPVHG
jgi:hypothetical protein